MTKSIELGLISQAERKYIDQPLERGLVARILVKALKLLESGAIVRSTPLALEGDGTGGPVVDEPVLLPSNEIVTSSSASFPPSATNFRHEFSGSALTLSWDSSFEGPFKVYRETVGGTGEILLGTTGGKLFTDTSAKAGKQYYYRVELREGGATKSEVLITP